jgi:ABC-2 type transport system permease protein
VFAFFENNFQYVLALLLECAALTAAALAVLSARDHGQGIIPARRGHAAASRFLRGPFGLAWRLTKSSAIIWCAVMFIIGAMYGSMFGQVEEFINKNDYYKQIISAGVDVQGSMIDAFVSFLFVIMSIISAIPVIGVANKIHAEEKRGRLEPVLARSVSRARMFGSYIMIGVAESAAVQLCAALGVFSSSKGIVALGDMLPASLAYIPALLVMLGFTVFLVGALPKLTALVWAVYGYSFFAAFFGRLFELPEVIARFSPFGNVPQLPVSEFSAAPLIIMLLLSAALIFLGVRRFEKRDIE